MPKMWKLSGTAALIEIQGMMDIFSMVSKQLKEASGLLGIQCTEYATSRTAFMVVEL